MIVAVIGHGPSPEGRGWGPAIDACDFVVRMWECGWQAPADYGTRYDAGVFTIWPNELKRFRAFRAAQPQPARWWAYDLRGLGMAALTEPAEIMDPRPWNERARRAGGCGLAGRFELTRGGMAALHAIATLRPRRLHLIGFDTLRAGAQSEREHAAAFAARYGATAVRLNNPLAPGAPRSGSHDFAAERRLIEETGVEIAWTL